MSLLQQAQQYIQQRFSDSESPVYPYHNWEHTEFVYNKAKEIIQAEGIDQETEEQILLATLFHDIGYLMDVATHEEKSAVVAKEWLGTHNYPTEKIDHVCRLILSTKNSEPTTTIEEKIMRDADISHLGTDYFWTFTARLRKEFEILQNTPITIKEWNIINAEFLESVEYQTSYGKLNWNPVKLEHLTQIRSTIKTGNKKKKEKEKKVSSIPEKGIETMFRVTLRNHINLSSIADSKANTLLSVNAIIISIVLSTMYPKLDNNPNLLYPMISMLITNAMTIVFSILSTLPSTTSGKISKELIVQKKGNLLFFGNFYRMNLDEFEWGINQLMKDREYLYGSLTRDLYFLGRVLNKKYRLLRTSYFVFLAGIFISIIVFAFNVRIGGPF